jgi:hypothetical protein
VRAGSQDLVACGFEFVWVFSVMFLAVPVGGERGLKSIFLAALLLIRHYLSSRKFANLD